MDLIAKHPLFAGSYLMVGSVTSQVSNFEEDVDKKVEAQAKKADHEEPAYSVTEVVTSWEKLDKAFNKVNNKKKPKPPPEPKPAAGSNDKTNSTEGEMKASGTILFTSAGKRFLEMYAISRV